MTFEAFRNLFGLLAVPAIGGLFWWINRVDMAAARSLWKGPNQGGTRRQAGDYGRRDPARLEGLRRQGRAADAQLLAHEAAKQALRDRSEEHTSELQSLMRISYAVFCLKKK